MKNVLRLIWITGSLLHLAGGAPVFADGKPYEEGRFKGRTAYSCDGNHNELAVEVQTDAKETVRLDYVQLTSRGSAMASAPAPATSVGTQEYSTCKTWQQLVEGKNVRYAPVIRVSDPGTSDRPAYTGFWFYDVRHTFYCLPQELGQVPLHQGLVHIG